MCSVLKESTVRMQTRHAQAHLSSVEGHSDEAVAWFREIISMCVPGKEEDISKAYYYRSLGSEFVRGCACASVQLQMPLFYPS